MAPYLPYPWCATITVLLNRKQISKVLEDTELRVCIVPSRSEILQWGDEKIDCMHINTQNNLMLIIRVYWINTTAFLLFDIVRMCFTKQINCKNLLLLVLASKTNLLRRFSYPVAQFLLFVQFPSGPRSKFFSYCLIVGFMAQGLLVPFNFSQYNKISQEKQSNPPNLPNLPNLPIHQMSLQMLFFMKKYK